MTEPLQLSDSRTRRWVYFVLGWLFFVLGVIGAVLPVVPTTPFMILALWAFSRSSARFHRWLYNHRVFGPRLQAWDRDRVVPLPVKLTAWIAMLVSLSLMTFVAKVPWYAVLGAASVMTIGAVYLARCPSSPPLGDVLHGDNETSAESDGEETTAETSERGSS